MDNPAPWSCETEARRFGAQTSSARASEAIAKRVNKERNSNER